MTDRDSGYQQALSPAARTRQALLDAGSALAGERGLAGMSVNQVVARAGVAKGTFYVHFADRDAFLHALHERFYAGVEATVAERTRGEGVPGEDGVWLTIETYLDACLADRAVRAVLVEARSDGALAEAASRRHQRAIATFEPGLRELGVVDAAAAARLLVAMVSEAALAELEAGRRQDDVRRALRAYLRGAAR